MCSTADGAAPLGVAVGAWRLDPQRSTVCFEAPSLWGLITVKRCFERFDGRLELAAEPAIRLVLDAASVDTKLALRDRHLRSEAFFDVEHHPEVSFVSERATLAGSVLDVGGRLQAGGRAMALYLLAAVRPDCDGFEVSASVRVDHRLLGMTWNPLSVVRGPTTLTVHGRLVASGE